MGAPKKLQMFFDGTANSAARGEWSDATNVFRLILALHYEGNQIVSYMPGVGTRGDNTSIITARGMDEILREAYVNLASNCLPGDEIYLFGYSRGGAIALALADMIAKIGLLWADDLHELSFVWSYYLGRRKGRALTDAERREIWKHHIEGKVRNGNEAPRIRFLGLFDPVPGNSWDTLTKFSSIRLNSIKLPASVDCATSLLSIDDNRVPSFKPIVLDGKITTSQELYQIWMPGVHGDIGGNSESVFLSDVALITMIEKARYHCPELIWDTGYIERCINELGSKVCLSISNERPGVFRKLLFKGNRIIENNNQRLASTCQFAHPITSGMIGKNILIRGRMQEYKPINFPADIEPYPTDSSVKFEKSAQLAIENCQSYNKQ